MPAILARYEHYINIYCWISNTYYVSFKEQTTSLTNKHERHIKYYQWVPLILLALAFCFLLPRFVYRFLSKQSGVDMLNMADAAVNFMTVEKYDKRRKIITYLTNTIHFYSTCNRAKRVKQGFGSNSAYNVGGGSGGGSGAGMISNNSSKPHIYDLICCHGKLNGSYLTTLYLFTKLSYIANSIGQLFLLNLFLGFNYQSQGFTLLKDITRNIVGDGRIFNNNPQGHYANNPNSFTTMRNGASVPLDNSNINPAPSIFTESVLPVGLDGKVVPSSGDQYSQVFNSPISSIPLSSSSSSSSSDFIRTALIHRYFPRESACDFRVRMNVDSMVHNYTVQCVLPINLFNEQLFTLLWVWLWMVCIINCYDLVIWILRVLPGSRYNYIRNRIRFKHSENAVKRTLNTFVYEYLSFDGVFLLRILSLNASDSVTHDIVQQLWNSYSEGNRATKQSGSSNPSGSRGAQSIHQRYSSRQSNDPHAAGASTSEGDSRYVSNYINIESI